MSRIKDIKRQLDEVCVSIETLDSDLAAGQIAGDEHARQRAERERDAGRILITLRHAQRLARERADAEADASPERGESPSPRPTAPSKGFWGPAVLVPAAVLLVAAGLGGGVAIGRLFQPAAAPAGATGTTPGPGASIPADSPSSALTPGEVEVLRQAASREDATIDGLLRYAHVALDRGQVDEARRVYERVLAREPRNVEAITHIGAVLYAGGRADEALQKVEEALRIEPGYIHAHWDRVQYLFQAKRDYPAAIKAGEAFLAVVPDGPDADHVRKLMSEAKQQVNAMGRSPGKR
jgi:tetratricopeptide (TPR) repeat protein